MIAPSQLNSHRRGGGRFVVAVVAALAAAPAAFAADVLAPAPAYTKAPIAVPDRWSGFYVGGDVGYGRTNSSYSFSDPGNAGFDACGPCQGPWDSQNDGATGNGLLAGLHLGYNTQLMPSWIVGVEGEFTWSRLKDSSTTALSMPAPGPGSTTFPSSLTFQTNVNWLASVRGRAGYAHDNWLAYATAGVAWASADTRASANCPIITGFCGPDFGEQAVASRAMNRTGFVVGGGLEWQPTTNPWRVRAEYLYYRFDGSDSVAAPWLRSDNGAAFTCISTPSCSANFSVGGLTLQTVRVGLSYAFH